MTTSAASATTKSRIDEPRPADVFVAFGITGDLAKMMTLMSLYRLERRGLIDCPIVGVAVDDWTVDQLKERARDSIVGAGEQLDPKVFERFADRLSYVSGDFSDPATYARVAEAIDGAESPVFYLEIPPFLFDVVVKGLSEAGLSDNARIVVEKPFGHDLASARELADELHEYIDESQLYRIDHFLGKMGTDEILWRRGSRAAAPRRSPRDASARGGRGRRCDLGSGRRPTPLFAAADAHDRRCSSPQFNAHQLAGRLRRRRRRRAAGARAAFHTRAAKPRRGEPAANVAAAARRG
jgi:hypothetical protein